MAIASQAAQSGNCKRSKIAVVKLLSKQAGITRQALHKAPTSKSNLYRAISNRIHALELSLFLCWLPYLYEAVHKSKQTVTMTLLIVYVVVALLFSFLCSILEAVLLSVTTAHINVLEQEGKSAGPLLRKLKADINKPLAAILTLNTIAHTVGAVGASGCQVQISLHIFCC